jgi:hypothetical protein
MLITHYTFTSATDVPIEVILTGYLEKDDDIFTSRNFFIGKSVKITILPDSTTIAKIDDLIDKGDTTSRPIITNSIGQLKVKED